MSESRRDIDDDTLRGLISWQLQRMGQDLRNVFARRKDGTEKVMAHMIVAAMRKRGFHTSGPVHDPESAIVGNAYPPKPDDPDEP